MIFRLYKNFLPIARDFIKSRKQQKSDVQERRFPSGVGPRSPHACPEMCGVKVLPQQQSNLKQFFLPKISLTETKRINLS